MPGAGWFYRSFANSFTRCLTCLARAARVAFDCRLRLFFPSMKQKFPMYLCHAGLDPASMSLGPWIAGQARNDSHLKPALL